MWRPDIAAINTPVCREVYDALPAAAGFKPLKDLSPVSDALTTTCFGAAAMIEVDGAVHEFAGDTTKLYRLGSLALWSNVTRTVGGPYAAGGSERWSFANFAGLMIATTIGSVMQKFNVRGGASNFVAVGGSPPQCRYVAVVRDFVVIGGIQNFELRVQWSGLANADYWTPGTNNSDIEDIQSGGPVRGIIGGETGYVFQASRITRMTFQPGSTEVFSFDEVENGRGLAAPYSLTRLGRTAYYFASDGLYSFDVGSAVSTPLGVGKWAQWFLADVKPGAELLMLGGIDPSQKLVLFAYVPRSSNAVIPSRVLLYDWSIDEASVAQISVTAMAQWLTQGVTLDTMDGFGTIETLPFSLDSPAWQGGAGLLGLFGTDSKLGYLSGSNRSAVFTTSDGQKPGRQFIGSTRPAIDTSSVTVEIAMRERDADAVTFDTAEAMEDDGTVPAHISGNIARARITIAAGATWALAKGIETANRLQGKR